MQLSDDGQTLLKVDKEDIQPDGSYVISEKVTAIDNWAFKDCTTLKSLTIPSSIISIGHGAFESCINLHTLTIPASVTSMGYCVFLNCPSLHTLSLLAGVTSIGIGLFSYCIDLETVALPSNVASIGDEAFSGCARLQTLTLPANVSSIDKSAFKECTNLTLIIIATNNEAEIARITTLLPDELKSKVISQDFVKETLRLREAQLARLIRIPQTNRLYHFFNYTDNKRERSMEQQYGYLPPEILWHINEQMGESNLYYHKAKSLIERKPWPKTHDKLKIYEAEITKIVDEHIEKAVEWSHQLPPQGATRRA